MHSEIYIYRVICPECGTVHFGFVGNNEDGSFYCDASVEIKKGYKIKIERCGYSIEKIRHLPEKNYELIKVIKIEEFGFAEDAKAIYYDKQ